MQMLAGVSVAEDPVAGLRTLLNMTGLLDRDYLVEQLQKLADAAKQHNAALAEIAQRERALLEREREATLNAERLAAYAADLAGKEEVAKAQIKSAETKIAELRALRSEMKMAVAA
jgi:hypothetical protein